MEIEQRLESLRVDFAQFMSGRSAERFSLVVFSDFQIFVCANEISAQSFCLSRNAVGGARS